VGIDFNANEVLLMAERIEQNGQKFYRGAVQRTDDPENKELLQKLAEMEVEHEATFATMRSQLGADEKSDNVFDPESRAFQYLQAMADNRIFDVNVDPEKVLAGTEGIEEVLRIAIGMEKDSVVFYQGIKDAVPDEKGKDKVSEIIKEEMWHITVLSRRLTEITK
jgi:rubrerythrin